MKFNVNKIPAWLRFIGPIIGALLLGFMGDMIYDKYIKKDDTSAKFAEIIQQAIEESKQLKQCEIPDSLLSNAEIQRMRKLQLQIKHHFSLLERFALENYDVKEISDVKKLEAQMLYNEKFKLYSESALKIQREFGNITDLLAGMFPETYLNALLTSSGITLATLREFNSLLRSVDSLQTQGLKELRICANQFTQTKDPTYVKQALRVVSDTYQSNDVVLEMMRKHRDLFISMFDFLNMMQAEIVFANND